MNAHSIDRRNFLRQTAGAAAALALSPAALPVAAQEPKQLIRLAVIGHMYVADHFFTSVHAYDAVQLVAICNPDQRKVPEIFKKWQEQADKLASATRPEDKRAAEVYRSLLDKKPPVFADFREMLAKMGEEIDAVIVSMYDHYHGPACGAAMRAGKHVFSERPLGLTISESRALRDLAAKQKVATSIRNPGNASNQFRRGVELIREDALGSIEEVHVWFDRGGPDLQQTPQGTEPVPEGLHWDLWLGPVAARPYHPQWMAYAQWRETSNGGIGTFGPHAGNLAFMALKVHDLWAPDAEGTIRVRAEVSRLNRLSFPRWEKIHWLVPKRGNLPAVKFTWHHGPKLPPGSRDTLVGMMTSRGATPEEAEKLLGYAGAFVIGSKGALATDDHNVKITLLPKDGFTDVPRDKPLSLSPSRGHYHDWFNACRGGEPTWANYTYANALSEFLMLGNVATQFDVELEYDPRAGKFLNHPEANTRLGYTYRKGWTL